MKVGLGYPQTLIFLGLPSPPSRSRTPILSTSGNKSQQTATEQLGLSPLTHPPHPPAQAKRTSHSTADEYHKRGFEFRKQGNFSQAIVEYSKAIEVDPNHFKAYFNRAFAYDKLHEYRLAIADYTSAISLDRMNSYAYYNRGITYDKLGDFQHACEDFQHALSLQSQNIDFMYNLALSFKKLNNFTEAIQNFKQCLEIDSNHLKSLQSLGSCYERMGQYDDAMFHYDAALHIAPQNISTLISKANLLHILGGEENYHLSIRLYSSILDLLYPDGSPIPRNPGNDRRREEAISIIYSRAHVYEDLNDLKSSIRDLTLAIELATQLIGTSTTTGPLREGLNAIPLSVLYSTRGIYYKSLEKYQQAIDDFNLFFQSGKPQLESSELNLVSVASVYNHRGYCYRKLEQYAEAIADYSEAICLQPANIKGYNNRAYCYAKIGEYQKAIHDYTSVISIDELNAHAYHNRGISYDKLGIFDKAIEDFSKVIELDASNHPYREDPQTFSLSTGQFMAPSGRSTPGMFTPIRTNETTSSNQSRNRTENATNTTNSRSHTPTNGLRRESKNTTGLSARSINKSPTPSPSPRLSLQDSIRAKMMSPSPRKDEQTNSFQKHTSPGSNVQEQIIGIQDAARRLAALSIPKNQKSRPTTPNSQVNPNSHPSRVVKSTGRSDIHTPSQSSYLDANPKNTFPHRPSQSSSHRFSDNTSKFDKL